MGFLDRFKKQNKKDTNIIPKAQETSEKYESSNGISLSRTEEGRLVVELYEGQPKVGQFYDTTKLVIDTTPVCLANNLVQSCKVAWYGQDDVIDLKGKYGLGRRDIYRSVLAEIDMDLLQSDSNYRLALMKNLMNQKRVEQYLERGLQDNPDTPCGQYIGGVISSSKGYEKIFDLGVGEAAHNLPEMVQKRQRIKEKAEAAKARDIADKKAQIAKLQGEIEELGK